MTERNSSPFAAIWAWMFGYTALVLLVLLFSARSNEAALRARLEHLTRRIPVEKFQQYRQGWTDCDQHYQMVGSPDR